MQQNLSDTEAAGGGAASVRTTARSASAGAAGIIMEDNLSSTAHRLFVLAYAIIIALAIMVATSCGVVTDYWHSTINGCMYAYTAHTLHYYH